MQIDGSFRVFIVCYRIVY